MTTSRRWLAVVIGLLAVHVTAVAVLIVQSRGLALRVVPDAYQRAVAFNETLAVMAVSDELGWRADAHLAAVDATRDQIEIELTDGRGAPVTGFSKAKGPPIRSRLLAHFITGPI